MLEIRVFQPSDADTLRALLVDSFDGVSIDQNIERRLGPAGSHDWGWRKGRHLDDDVCRDPQGVFVALVDGEIAGFVSTWIDREASVGYIPNLAVRKENRAKGIGRRLLEYALNRFRREGVALARIETLDQNPIGQHLYPSVGFVEVARQIHFAMRLDDRDL
jgi:ribosomal protein S18 acetylase RimI-like enzyme